MSTTQLTGDTLLHQHALNISRLQTSNQHLSKLQVQSLALQQRTTNKFHHCCLHQAPQKPTPPGKQAGKFGRVGLFSQAWGGAPRGSGRKPISNWEPLKWVSTVLDCKTESRSKTVLPPVYSWSLNCASLSCWVKGSSPPPLPHNHQDKDHNNKKAILHLH